MSRDMELISMSQKQAIAFKRLLTDNSLDRLSIWTKDGAGIVYVSLKRDHTVGIRPNGVLFSVAT